MLHPDHLHPNANVDTNKLAWLAWWEERRTELVGFRNYDLITGIGASIAFVGHYVDGPRWGAFLLGCVLWVTAIYFFIRRRINTDVQQWDEIGQRPYKEQCEVVLQKMAAEGKPGWLNGWYLLAAPLVWVLVQVVELEWVWTEKMTHALWTGLIFGVVINFFHQGRLRKQWQEGMDIATKALED